MKAIIEKPDGTVAVVIPAPRKLAALMETMSEAEAMKVIVSSVIEKAAYLQSNGQPVDALLAQCDPDDAVLTSDDSQLADRSFRNAWRKNGNGIRVDMPAARELLRGKIREARKPLFAENDNALSAARRNRDTQKVAEIEAKQQTLADLPSRPEIDAATTPDELKDTWPANTLGPSPFSR